MIKVHIFSKLIENIRNLINLVRTNRRFARLRVVKFSSPHSEVSNHLIDCLWNCWGQTSSPGVLAERRGLPIFPEGIVNELDVFDNRNVLPLFDLDLDHQNSILCWKQWSLPSRTCKWGTFLLERHTFLFVQWNPSITFAIWYTARWVQPVLSMHSFQHAHLSPRGHLIYVPIRSPIRDLYVLLCVPIRSVVPLHFSV